MGGIYNVWGCLYLIPYFAAYLPRPAPQWSLVSPSMVACILCLSITILLCMSWGLKHLFSCFLLSSPHPSFRVQLQTALHSRPWFLFPRWLASSLPFNSFFYYLVSLRTKSCNRARRKCSSEGGTRKGESWDWHVWPLANHFLPAPCAMQ